MEVVLYGQHIGRIVETVKMFLALHRAGLPIWICDAESVRNRILGLDHFGIMPDSDSLHRGCQEFPEDFHIEDVMHLRSFGRARRAALPFISWKPLPVLHGFKFSGEYHQYGEYGMPMFEDGSVLFCSWRHWGSIMAEAWDPDGDKGLDYMDFYMPGSCNDEKDGAPKHELDFV